MIPMRIVAPAAVFLAAVFLVAGLGGMFTSSGLEDWYRTLEKPAFNPPDSVFGPVWTVLYLLMAVSATLVWLWAGWPASKVPLTLFGVQLGLNLLWSLLFFGLGQPGWAFVELVVLWGAILATLVAFWRVSPLAGALLVPYLVWVSFAGVLNFSIWQLNR